MLSYIYSFDTDIGLVRKRNEDYSYATVNRHGDILLTLLDGMGGHVNGQLASRTTLNLLLNEFKDREKPFASISTMKKWLTNCIKDINKKIYALSSMPENKNMGTTLVCVLISASKVVYTSIGDSRCYICNNNQLTQITEDDSVCYDLYKKGEITKEEINTHPKRNEITKAIGLIPNLKFKVHILKEKFTRILLCSDGLYNKLNDDEIKKILYKKIDIKIKVSELIESANAKGGEDNIGVLICEVIK